MLFFVWGGFWCFFCGDFCFDRSFCGGFLTGKEEYTAIHDLDSNLSGKQLHISNLAPPMGHMCKGKSGNIHIQPKSCKNPGNCLSEHPKNL